MSFAPDILVEIPGTTDLQLAVKARTQDGEPEDFLTDLFQYLRGRRCDFALLVTPGTVTLYRDHWTGDAPDAIQRSGPLPLGRLFGPLPPLSGDAARFDFENRVQAWIEQLTAGQLDERIPLDTREVLRRELLPYLWYMDVRAAGPRWRRTA